MREIRWSAGYAVLSRHRGPFALAETAPDAIRLLDGQGVLATLLDDRALRAQPLRGGFSPLSFGPAFGLR